MTFKEVRQGNTVFVFDRNTVTVKKGVTSMVSLPHIDPKAPLNAGMVIDIDITVDGQTGKYVVPETSESVTTAGGLYLTPNNALLLNDIQNVKQQRQLVLNSVEQYKKDIEKCDTLLAEICEVVDMRQARKNTSIPDYKVLWDKLQITGGMYLVTKSWYDGHKSSEMVKAKDAAEAFAKSSDNRRNLDYYIESVYKQMS